MSTKILKILKMILPKNGLEGHLRYQDFWNRRIEIYQKGVPLGRSEVSPKIWEVFKTALLKNGWTALIYILLFFESVHGDLSQMHVFRRSEMSSEILEIFLTCAGPGRGVSRHPAKAFRE